MLNGIENFHRNQTSKTFNSPVYNTQNTKSQSNLAFCGLKKQFEKNIYLDYQTLQAIYNVNAKNKTMAGKPPREIVNAIKANPTSDFSVSESIKRFMGAFSLASHELIKAETKSLECIDGIDESDFNRYICDFVFSAANYDLSSVISDFTPYFGVNRMPEDERKEYEKSAAIHIEQAAKDIGIISDEDRVELEYIGIGTFGTVYNVSFKDRNGEKIFHDKALKVYRDRDNEFTARKAIFQKFKAICDTMTFDEFYQKYSTVVDDFLTSYNEREYPLKREQYNNAVSNKQKILKDLYNIIISADSDDFEDAFIKSYYPSMNIHGCLAEANRAAYLKNAVSHIETSDYIEPYFFDLESGFGLFEKADNSLPEIKTVIDLSKLNLEHGDLDEDNEHNKVCGRVVDYGGIREKNYLVSYLFYSIFKGLENWDNAKTAQATMVH